MGMSTYVVGIRPPDARFLAMKAIYDACEAAGVEPPAAVDDFFGQEPPDPAGVLVDIGSTEWGDDNSRGLEVDITRLPKDVTVVRFYNSY